jgi:hypothetical protein
MQLAADVAKSLQQKRAVLDSQAHVNGSLVLPLCDLTHAANHRTGTLCVDSARTPSTPFWTRSAGRSSLRTSTSLLRRPTSSACRSQRTRSLKRWSRMGAQNLIPTRHTAPRLSGASCPVLADPAVSRCAGSKSAMTVRGGRRSETSSTSAGSRKRSRRWRPSAPPWMYVRVSASANTSLMAVLGCPLEHFRLFRGHPREPPCYSLLPSSAAAIFYANDHGAVELSGSHDDRPSGAPRESRGTLRQNI